MSGPLDEGRLKAALDQVVERHEILHTTFRTLPGMTLPLQVIAPSTHRSLDAAALEGAPAATPADLLAFARTIPIDLREGPVLTSVLVQPAADEHLLLLVLPALCADEATLDLLANDLAAAYGGSLPEELEAPQYIDVSEWQHELLQDPDYAEGRSFWQSLDWECFLNPAVPAHWPTAADAAPATALVPVDHGAAAALNDLASRCGYAPQMLWMAAWLAFLSRVTDHNPLPSAVLLDGRKFDELRAAVGLLARYLPLPTSVDGSRSLLRLAEQLNTNLERATQVQESFSWDFAPATVAQAGIPFGFAYRAAAPSVQAGAVQFQIVAADAAIDQAVLALRCEETPAGVAAVLHAEGGHIAGPLLARLAEEFATLLAAAIAQPEAPIERLPLLGAAERARILGEFGQSGSAEPAQETVIAQIRRQAELTPAAPAVVAADGSLSYDELIDKAGRLAGLLQSRGVGPESRVGLLMERTTGALVGILGIWLAGAAYLPIDPGLPQARIALLLDDSGAVTVVTQPELHSALPESMSSITLDELADAPASKTFRDPAPNHLAYIIYTSGSTGLPKGVAVEHRQLSAYVQGVSRRLEWPDGASFASVSTLGADLGHTALFPTLCAGGAVHLMSSEDASNADKFSAWMHSNAVDGLKIVPSHLAALLSAANPERVLPQQRLVTGGEAMPWQLIRLIRQLAPECRIFNHYGPTETTVGALTYAIPDHIPEAGSGPPLGRPIPNAQVYILDRWMQPVPIGLDGEIYIGGLGVARGYLNRPELTAERFIPDPFSAAPGSRLYRTGDLGRFDEQGNVVFLGRSDDQIKLRGFRIELGEIAAALRSHPSVRDAVVIAHKQERSDPRLIGYIVPEGKPAPTFRALRNHIKQSLPDYMVPATVMVLEQIPLTPNGKLDRKALPVPEASATKTVRTYVAPRTPTETALVEIWSEVLPGRQIGIHDNFFELGGDSIISIQIVARATQRGLQISPKQLFMYPTVAGLAEMVNTAPTIQADQSLVTGDVPLTPVQRWFFEQKTIDPHHYNQAVLFELRETFDPLVLEESFQALVQHHDALRLRFEATEGGWRQFYDENPQPVRLEVIDLAAVPAQEQAAALTAAADRLQSSLNLTSGPLLRVALFAMGPDQPQRLLIILHHLVVDSVSWQILLGDLGPVYQQLAHKQPIQLPAKTTSFKQWAEWLNGHASASEIQAELGYWTSRPYERVAALPTDLADLHQHERDNAVATVALSADETQALLEASRTTYLASTQEVLLAALLRAVQSWTGATALLIEMEGHGREDIAENVDLSRTVGWFTSRFPLLLAASGDDEAAAIKAVKEQMRAVPQRGIGYGLLRYLDAQGSAALSALPQPEISFNFLSQYGETNASATLVWAKESVGALHSPNQERIYRLEVNAVVERDQLRLDITYGQKAYLPATIDRLAAGIAAALRTMIRQSQDGAGAGYAPSDFPQANLSQSQLDSFLAKLAKTQDGHERQ